MFGIGAPAVQAAAESPKVTSLSAMIRMVQFGVCSVGDFHRTSGTTTVLASPRTQNPVQHWQLRRRLSVEQAAHRIGISPDRYGEVVVLGNSRFTEEEIQRVLAATAIDEARLRQWERRPRGDTRNPPAR